MFGSLTAQNVPHTQCWANSLGPRTTCLAGQVAPAFEKSCYGKARCAAGRFHLVRYLLGFAFALAWEARVNMASPFCTICKGLGDTEGRLSCEAFPLGIPKKVYPYGCGPRGSYDFGFMPKHGFEEMEQRWRELEKKEGVAWM